MQAAQTTSEQAGTCVSCEVSLRSHYMLKELEQVQFEVPHSEIQVELD